MRGKFLKICWPAVSPVRGCQVTCRGWGEIINTGSPGSTPAVVNRQQSSQHPSRQDADSQDDQTSLQKDQEQAPAAQASCHQDDHHRGGAWQHRQRGPGGGTPLQIKRIKKNVQKVHGLLWAANAETSSCWEEKGAKMKKKNWEYSIIRYYVNLKNIQYLLIIKFLKSLKIFICSKYVLSLSLVVNQANRKAGKDKHGDVFTLLGPLARIINK